MAYRSRIFSPPPPLPRAPPKEVFPEESRGPNGLQLTTIFWETNIRFHAHAHACWMVGGRFEVFECKATHVSTNSTAPPHAGYWQHIPSKGSRVGTPESTPSSSSPPRYNEPSPRGHVLTPMRGTSHASDALQASALAQAYPTSQSVPSDSYLRGRAFGAHRPERASWSIHHTGTGPGQTTPSPYARPGGAYDGQFGSVMAGVRASSPGPSYSQTRRRSLSRVDGRGYDGRAAPNADGVINSAANGQTPDCAA